MLSEVAIAAGFFTKLLRTRCNDPNQVSQFRESLEQIMADHYQNHWFPEKPHKGSGYRCIRIVEAHMDPLLGKAAHQCGLSGTQLAEYLPNEITMWVDPSEVSYRFGEEGSIGMLYTSGDCSGYSDDSTSSSSDSEVSVGSPAPSPTQELIHGSTCRTEADISFSTHYYNNVRNVGMFVPPMQFVAS